jgi:alpha-glucosidase (family GH31 glycosyl hydrolase)
MWDKPEGAMNLWHDPEATNLFREYARLHISLFPYLYTYATEAENTGLPIMRHLLFADPADPHTWDADDEYLLGDRILVAPVIHEGATSRSLYLPAGSWTNYWTGKVMDGGRTVTISAPLDQIPVFVRAGSILPFIPPDTETLVSEGAGDPSQALTKDLIWRVYSSTAPVQQSFRLFDGTLAAVDIATSSTRITVSGAPLLRNYEVIVPVRTIPKEVVLNGKRLGEVRLGPNGEQKAGWSMAQGDHCLHVFLHGDNFVLEIDGDLRARL